jgi:hypothetical protein
MPSVWPGVAAVVSPPSSMRPALLGGKVGSGAACQVGVIAYTGKAQERQGRIQLQPNQPLMSGPSHWRLGRTICDGPPTTKVAFE